MMGKPNQIESKLFYHGVSLERRMPNDHPLRKIKQLVDFNFIRSKVADLYGIRGNKSVDPAVILKLMFLLFYENVKSERALKGQIRQVGRELYEKLDEGYEPKPLVKRQSKTDPDARLGRKYGKTTLGYKDHRVVDDKNGIVTATKITPANVNDEKVLTDVIEEHQANTDTKAKVVATDKAYGTGENYKYLHQQGITPCIGHKRNSSNCHPDFNIDKFIYDELSDLPNFERILNF